MSNQSKGSKNDMTGEVFGRLTVVSSAGSNDFNKKIWLCLCSCGNTKKILGSLLRRGDTKSCGCYRRETVSEIMGKHRMKNTAEYSTWSEIKKRCYNSNFKQFKDYGGRGVKVCGRWLNSFENFFEDMGVKPTPKHSIERIENNGDYEKSNCKWATDFEQAANRRNNHWIEYDGKRMILQDWAAFLGTKQYTICRQLHTKTFPEIFNYYINKNKVAI